MITIATSKSSATHLVEQALIRSCCANMVAQSNQVVLTSEPEILIFISPTDAQVEIIQKAIRASNKKIIILGAIPESLCQTLNITVFENYDLTRDIDCPDALPNQATSSKGAVIYKDHIFSRPFKRYFCRYDYSDEWNNLGYGKISATGIYSIAMPAFANTGKNLGTIQGSDERSLTFASIIDTDQAAVLWINREIATVDGPDWKIVEDFISAYRSDTLPTSPVLRDVPFGYQSAVTMRLDCDEDITSSNAMIELYNQYDFPLSIAVKSSLLEDPSHLHTLQKIVKYGGSILSHSHLHYAQWGGDYETALQEATQSKKIIEDASGVDIDYVVSPFHQTPTFARRAINDAGYKGCIGGVMNSDPDFILSKGGMISHDYSLIGHSQQSMFHGHTVQAEGNPLRIFEEAFYLSSVCGQIYGYLDHPFSDRYWYDWESEDIRLSYHEMFLKFLAKQPDNLMLSENDCLKFISLKSSSFVHEDGQVYCKAPALKDLKLAFTIGQEVRQVHHAKG